MCAPNGWAGFPPRRSFPATRSGSRRQRRSGGQDIKAFVASGLAQGKIRFACTDPDDPANWPRNLFVWRSNLLGSSGKGHEYFLKHLLGAPHGVQGKDSAKPAGRSRVMSPGTTGRRKENSISL